jgi:predicted ArsR family transcriptional regulator
VVERLKRSGHSTACQLAGELGITESAVRQHLDALAAMGLVEGRTLPPNGRGRPATTWNLTDLARGLFPDRHADLTVELLDAVSTELGPDALDAVISAREKLQLARYRAVIPEKGTVAQRAEALARARSAEGYMAEVTGKGDRVELVEHHCPICEAASTCRNFCRSELAIFEQVLGPDVRVERTRHLLSGDERCAYTIEARTD